MKRLMFVCLLALALPTLALAQPEAEEPTPPTQWYGTTAGIVAATMIGVGVLKKAFAKVPALSQLPLWLYAVIISTGLTYLANQVWHTMPGDLWQLLTQSVSMAAAASGFWSWLNSDTTIVKSLMRPLSASDAAQDMILKG